MSPPPPPPPQQLSPEHQHQHQHNHNHDHNQYNPPKTTLTHTFLTTLTPLLPPIYQGVTLPSFLALLFSTCSNYMLAPIRDATALTIGVHHIPNLTIASTILALASSVPVGWLFEAPDPSRRRFFRNWGLTRGDTQGSSLALFYRFFAFFLLVFGCGSWVME
eukprot:CAMPEP_0172481924 /NCGR_PEP_ID=MMETSP1066-20121228/8113_1 /TAXON_ID=671091 /ORGANISM="Coscinodiscus wailesii, Strain CCMP2513" /LENGTH=161 /DNA_ID=CAMNT_0013244655 /DNA_START=135 /DNA_END=617 /DNA_ORIENTATION=-